MKSEIRVFGPEFNQERGFIDLRVVGVDTDGSTCLEEINPDSTSESQCWNVGNKKVKKLFEQNLALGLEEASNLKSELWETFSYLYSVKDGLSDGDVEAERNLSQSIESLFKSIVLISKA
jgi:hypothetical protein